MNTKTLIIAEAGVNHNGDINTAKRLIDVAANTGVDFVKFQTFKADKLASKTAKKLFCKYLY
jgi:N,N'-diacetyllegionaminate synthase